MSDSKQSSTILNLFRSEQDPQDIFVSSQVKDGIRIPVITNKIREHFAVETGIIPYPLTNDRMFRGAVSYSEKVRRGLAAILLGMEENQIISVQILNPISFGNTPDEKETEEDIELLVNGRIMIDIDLQNLYYEANNKRFLLYLCRNYDTIGKGKAYNDLRSNLFVGILNYTFDKKAPEFYAQYRLMNIRTGKPLFQKEDVFGFNILDLSMSDLADEHDKASGRLLLAGLMKARTWEELRELCAESAFAMEVAEIMYTANADLRERIHLESARRHEEMQRTIQYDMERQEQALKQMDQELQQKSQELQQKSQELQQKRRELQQKEQELQLSQRESAEVQKQVAQERKRAEQAEAEAKLLREEIQRLRQMQQ